MKNCNLFLLIIVVCFTVHCSSHAANVVWDSVGLFQNDVWDYSIGTETQSGVGAGLLMTLVHGGGTFGSLESYNYTTGVGHIWFETMSGTAVDGDAVNATEPFMNAFIPELGTIDMVINQIFYIGYYVGAAGGYNGEYGWASLVWNGTELDLLDSAAETTGVGIYAGTYTAVPEPASAGLLLAGALLLFIRRRC
ncbi:MAG: PEP-CTERM sorting domain-containing protein [Kiritimatiellae bacterium]|jgi:hypothetical protein|nr:PEP-CTERM sorting domain-containing protein [Kiritimatiellia bacterium]